MLKRVVMSLCLVLLVAFSLKAQGKELPEEPTYAAGILGLFEWQSNTTLLIEDATFEGLSTWILYDAEQHTFSPFDLFSSSPRMKFLADHPTAPLVLYDSLQRTGLVYVSPNENFAVYATYPEEDRGYSVTLTNLVTGEANIIDGLNTRHSFSPNTFQVHWSDNSQAFYVTLDYGPVVLYYYVTGFSEDIDQARMLALTDQHSGEETGFSSLTDYHGFISSIYDIDPSGQFLLITGGISVSGEQEEVKGLIILNTATLIGEEVSRGGSIAARFTEDSKVNYITRKGVFEYNMVEQTTRLRNPDINTDWIERAAFSLDGCSIAITRVSPRSYLYVLEIDAELPAQTPTPTPIP